MVGEAKRLDPGPLAVTNVRWGYLHCGIISALIGITAVFLSVTDSSAPRDFYWVTLAGVLIIIVGIAFMALAFTRSANTLYVKKDRCNILEGKIHCSGGCMKCSFAATYLQRGPERDALMADSRTDYESSPSKGIR